MKHLDKMSLIVVTLLVSFAHHALDADKPTQNRRTDFKSGLTVQELRDMGFLQDHPK